MALSLYVVARKAPADEPENEVEIRSEWACWAEDPQKAAASFIDLQRYPAEEADVPDAWYDSDQPIPGGQSEPIAGILVFGPYETK